MLKDCYIENNNKSDMVRYSMLYYSDELLKKANLTNRFFIDGNRYVAPTKKSQVVILSGQSTSGNSVRLAFSITNMFS